MDLIVFGEMAITLELILGVVELIAIVIVLIHIKGMGEHDELEREELKEIKRLHGQLDEAVALLKEDIKELNENEADMHEAVKLLKEDIKELNENQADMHEMMRVLAEK